MSETQVASIRAEIGFWACLILVNVAPQWWARGLFLVGAVALRLRMYWLDRKDRGPGFWAKVWTR